MNHRPRFIRIHTGLHGWLLRSITGPSVTLLRIEDLAPATEGDLDQRESEPGAIHLDVVGHVGWPIEVLDVIDYAVAGSVDLSERLITVLAEELDDKHLHRGLIKIDRVADGLVLDQIQVFHRVISRDARLRAHERNAKRRAMVAEYIAASKLSMNSSSSVSAT